MPKKTKKEKIIAEYRKKLKLLQLSNTHQLSSSPPISVDRKPTASPAPAKQMYVSSQEDQVISHYFTQDLKKSLLLIGGIIALEILLYFVSINNNLRLIK